LYLDLDDFKVVNDSLGHQTGDRLLLAVAERLRGCLRPGDTAARMGGDEFTVLLADVSMAEDAVGVADRLANELRAPFLLDGNEVVVNASIGIAASDNRWGDAEDLLRRADVAMYDAKKRGKGQYRLFESEMDTLASERLRLESEMRTAVRQQEFRLYFQPIIDLDSGLVTELEALVRWDHPRQGLIGPDGFIPLAEETGLILPPLVRRRARSRRPGHRHRPRRDRLRQDTRPPGDRRGHRDRRAARAATCARLRLRPGRLLRPAPTRRGPRGVPRRPPGEAGRPALARLRTRRRLTPVVRRHQVDRRVRPVPETPDLLARAGCAQSSLG
jgi:diguanylate cyclase (GGDEF)-like protein